ncbi:MAG TPA: ArgE/DapE family deacylase [Solirubrobacteraceae bacterium]|nr:ArgE/DapE family deacylase [Solirubrobacteraceae bacterium]
MPLTPQEQQVCEHIAAHQDELIRLTAELVAFDTTAREPGDPPRQEAELQNHLAEILRASGSEVDMFEPDAATMTGKPLVPPGLDFAGRPQLIASRPGQGGGRSLVFNGHIDVVSGEPRTEWTTGPFEPAIRDGRLYGRGACDMKGGVAAMVFAATSLHRSGTTLKGDLIVATNTDEESSGAGGMALIQHGLKADAAIVTEPTGHDVWVACRGSEYGVVRVAGRPGHAEVRQPSWRDGGAVNAIEKAAQVIDAIQALRAKWADDPDLRHPHLSVPDLLPTLARSGEWAVTYPASCDLTIAVMYVPQQADGNGWGSQIRREVEQHILGHTAERDEWLAEHPPTFHWWSNPVMPVEIDPALPIVTTTRQASHDIGRPANLSGLDSWFDGATLTRFGGIPAVGYGPPGFDASGASVAHTLDEYVPIDGLVATAQALAVAAMRFCGVA